MRKTREAIIRKYWRFPWVFRANGQLIIVKPGRTIVFEEHEYIG